MPVDPGLAEVHLLLAPVVAHILPPDGTLASLIMADPAPTGSSVRSALASGWVGIQLLPDAVQLQVDGALASKVIECTALQLPLSI
jgi:hypothetical protein